MIIFSNRQIFANIKTEYQIKLNLSRRKQRLKIRNFELIQIKRMEFKQMENFYKKVIHDITQLIVNKSYKRAITLGQFLLSKGFRTNQLIVAISYAHKLLYGPKSAIQFIQKYSSNQKDNKQGVGLQKSKSPLIQMALTQYHLDNKKLKEAHQNIEQLQKFSDQFIKNFEQNRLCKILKQLHKNIDSQNSGTIDQEHQNLQNLQNVGQSQVHFITKQINQVTQNYLKQRDLLIKQDKIQGSQIAVKYGHFYVQYSQIKTKILKSLTQKIKNNSLHNINKKIKRKQNKFLKDIQTNTPKKIQIKQLTKNLLKQQQNQQNIEQTLQSNQKSTQKQQQFIIPSNQIQELQSLLAHINGFITFFKNKLKDYGGLRFKQLQFGDQQTQQQNIS